MKFFQLGVLIFFGFAILVGMLLFAMPNLFRSGENSRGVVSLVIWGPWPAKAIEPVIYDFNDDHQGRWRLTYEEKDPENYEKDLVEALASGTGPDIFVLPAELIVKHRNKLAPISSSVMSERQFRDTFIQIGELYLESEGIVALPVVVDPLVLYYNRDLLATAGWSQPPRYWNELGTTGENWIARLTRVTGERVEQSAIALGEFSNIPRAKEIFLTLLLQATGGRPFVQRLPESAGGYRYDVQLTSDFGAPATPPLDAVINFFSQFARSGGPAYTWSRALPNARDYFAAGRVALYLDLASAGKLIAAKNPNLNFDVALPPGRADDQPLTYGRVEALAVAKNSTQQTSAVGAVIALTGPKYEASLAANLALPPARKDLLNKPPRDPFQELFYRAALIARGWWDPNPTESRRVFQSMLQLINLGQLPSEQAKTRAQNELQNLYP